MTEIISESISFIPSVPQGVYRPLWSVMIPNYNCANFLRKTLESVLSQDPGPDVMQIMVVDNNSTADDPEAVVKEVGQGRVEFFRHPQNIGEIRNFNACLELSRGSLVHILHADDYVLGGFYDKIRSAFEAHPEIGSAFCRSFFVDESGKVKGLSELEMAESAILPSSEWLEKIASVCAITVPAIVVRREVYEKLGGYNPELTGVSDWEMFVRISAHCQLYYETEPLAAYRVHSQSMFATTVNSVKACFRVQHLPRLYKTVQINQSYLPETIRRKVFPRTKQMCAFYSLGTAELLLDEGAWKQAIAHIRLALRYSPSYRVVRSASRIVLLKGSYCLIKIALSHFLGRSRSKLTT